MIRKQLALVLTGVTALVWLILNPSAPPVRWLGPKMPVWSQDLSLTLATVLEDLDFPAEEWAFTEEDGSDLPYRTVGSRALEFKASKNAPIDARTGEPMVNTRGAPFNGAILKLPVGSKWQFLGVARGPLRAWDVPNTQYETVEWCLIGFGLNITASGRLYSVSEAYELDLPQQGPQVACNTGFVPYGWHGAEDPRLFWTDAGTPAMLFGRFSDHHLTDCRIIGMVRDMRTIFKELNDAMAGPSANLTRLPGEPSSIELRRDHDTQNIEKNWLPFYPGHVPNGSIVPHIQYNMKVAHALRPNITSLREIIYSDLLEEEERDECLGAIHSSETSALGDIHLHQATGLYRLTLCERGCVPREDNTVLMGLAHTKTYPSHYGRFIALFNTSFPFNPISAGPRIHLNGLNDDEVNFVLSMVPIVRSDLRRNPEVETTKSGANSILPNHFFLDDQLLISLGSKDNSMMSVLTSVKEIIAGQRLCSDLWEDEAQAWEDEWEAELEGFK